MPTRRWLRVCDLYRRFGAEVVNLDWSDEALDAMFIYESRGGDPPPPTNGPFVGKARMDITVAMWREDIAGGLLQRVELVNEFPTWWLDKVLPT